MMTKKFLERLLKAWPDEKGKSVDPNFFNEWMERERRYNARIIQNALGRECVLSLTKNQKEILEQLYADMLLYRDITDISDAELRARYQFVTEYRQTAGSEEINIDRDILIN